MLSIKSQHLRCKFSSLSWYSCQHFSNCVVSVMLLWRFTICLCVRKFLARVFVRSIGVEIKYGWVEIVVRVTVTWKTA
jgi:hypothetical protein